MPVAATRPCSVVGLPESPTQGDLDAALIGNAASVVTCDGARDLAVQTHEAEHKLFDLWLAMQTRRRFLGIF